MQRCICITGFGAYISHHCGRLKSIYLCLHLHGRHVVQPCKTYMQNSYSVITNSHEPCRQFNVLLLLDFHFSLSRIGLKGTLGLEILACGRS